MFLYHLANRSFVKILQISLRTDANVPSRDSGPRPPISKECCRSRGQMSTLRLCKRAKTRRWPPARARSTRRDDTRTRGIKRAIYLMPTPWLARHRLAWHPHRRYRLPPPPPRQYRCRNNACQRSQCGRGENWSPVLRKIGRDTCKLSAIIISNRDSKLTVEYQQ